jgi:adenylate cyclase class 2
VATEIEAKMKLDNPSAIASRLAALGAMRIGAFFEKNVFFDTPDSSLLTRDQGLRLRVRKDEHHQQQCWLTHKGPNQPGLLKTRAETELTVGDPALAENFLRALGFSPYLAFEKRRESWRHRDCLIELDELPRLGHFIEIEGPREDSILALRREVGLADAPLIRDPYPKLLAENARQHSLSITDVRF